MSTVKVKDQRVPVLMDKDLKKWGAGYAKRQGVSLSELLRNHLEDLRSKDIGGGKLQVEVFDVR